ncbi:hypothetical protein M0R45_031181 [Rubus argutus]|uniref:Uncharacterized protein n=1 Tax=Rubus argutus TaxID=59490 RepID=A0AAW1WDC7_RUBAR
MWDQSSTSPSFMDSTKALQVSGGQVHLPWVVDSFHVLVFGGYCSHILAQLWCAPRGRAGGQPPWVAVVTTAMVWKKSCLGMGSNWVCWHWLDFWADWVGRDWADKFLYLASRGSFIPMDE